MSEEILTSAEIDDIIGALAAPEAPAPARPRRQGEARPYDFRTADRFPKEQIRTLNIIFEAFAQLFSTRMAAAARGGVECELIGVTEVPFGAYVASLEHPMAVAVFKAPPMAGSQLAALSPEASYMFINRLLGGTSPVRTLTKQFTEIELALIRRILQDIAHTYEAAWEKVIRLAYQHERLETSPQFVQIAQTGDSVAAVGLDVRIGGESGKMSFCLPHSSVEPIAKHLNTRMWYAAATVAESSPERSERIRARLYRTPIPLSASFNETEASVGDILTLRAGDVIRLGHKLGEPVRVSVAHIPKFRASLGERGSRRALRLTEILKSENPDPDKENRK
ncbi:MAG: flagellar motor switch protein FliM [Clostridiales Family XIII bacterium]|nr:flagellar motor switch protein FliM [Clostridiales Family XIII bacterium]